MKRLNRILSLFLIGFSVLIFFSSLELGTGDPQNPGPGFMPFLASTLLFCLSLFIFLRGFKRSTKEEEKKDSPSWENFRKPVILLIMLAVFASLLETLGYIISASLLMFIMFVMYAPKKWHVHAVVATAVVILSFLFFKTLLGVQLPAGILRM